jgi:hypothetical protein
VAVAFVNSGARTNATATSLQAALPASLVQGNLMVGLWSFNSPPTPASFSIDQGWTILQADRFSDNDSHNVMAWKVAGASEIAPTLSWTTLSSGQSQVLQFSGQSAKTPIGENSHWTQNDAGSNSIQSSNDITATTASSLILACLVWNGGGVMPPTPTGYTQLTTSGTDINVSNVNFVQQTSSPSIGTQNTHISQSVGGIGNWGCLLLEIPGAQDANPQVHYDQHNFPNSLATITGTSITGSLPSWRATGDLLMGIVWTIANISLAFAGWPGDWTVVDTLQTADGSFAYAYRFVDGTETAPTITWSGSNSVAFSIMPFKNVGIGVIGVKTKNNGNSGTMALTGLTTQANNSLIWTMAMSTTASLIPNQVPGYTNDWYSTGGPAVRELHEQTISSGTQATNISQSVTAGHWMFAQAEILSPLSAVFRKTLSPIGGRIGSRQGIGWI